MGLKVGEGVHSTRFFQKQSNPLCFCGSLIDWARARSGKPTSWQKPGVQWPGPQHCLVTGLLLLGYPMGLGPSCFVPIAFLSQTGPGTPCQLPPIQQDQKKWAHNKDPGGWFNS